MKEPKLRFLADDGSSFPDLKEKRLNDVCEYNKGQSVGVNYVGTENMKQDFSGVNNLDSENEVKGVAYNIGDTLMSNIRPYLKKTWKADVNGVCSTDVLVFHPTDINNDYLYRNISSEKFISYVMTAAKGSKMPRGDKEHIMNYDIQVPCLSEQQKIASLFTELDKLIQSAEKELDGYRELKRGMLQKMFPKKGEKVPEIRFPEFTGDWKQRKLGDLAKIVGGGTPSTSKDEYWDGEIDWYAPAEITNQIYVDSSVRKITSEGFNNSSARMLPVGTVLFTSRAGIGKTAILRKEACTNQGFQSIVPRANELDSYFIFSRSEELKRYGETVGAGSTFVEVSGKQMSTMTLMMPPTMDEQQKIGNYFCNLDNLIALQQKELDGYKELKKGLLQQMFC